MLRHGVVRRAVCYQVARRPDTGGRAGYGSVRPEAEETAGSPVAAEKRQVRRE